MKIGTGKVLASDSMLQYKYFYRSDEPVYYIVLEISVVKNIKSRYYGRHQWKKSQAPGFLEQGDVISTRKLHIFQKQLLACCWAMVEFNWL